MATVNMADCKSTAIMYNSLTRFEMVSLIFDRSISASTIVDSVIESSNDKIFRSMIYHGICKYYQNTKDFTFIQNVHDKLQNNAKDTHDDVKIITTKNTTSNCEFFSVDDLVCKTMQYLDFHSLILCRLINKSFLYLTYNTSSTRYLDISNLFDIDNPNNVNELLRFQQVSKIELEPWCTQLNNLFKYLSTFRKLSNIIIYSSVSNNGYLDHCGKLSVEIIKNNKENISSVTLTAKDAYAYEKNYIPTGMIKCLINCRYLKELEISNAQLPNIDDKKHNWCQNHDNNNKLLNLKQLVLKDVSVDVSLFRSLLQLNMLKLEKLILQNIQITMDSQKVDNNVKIDINPNFVNIKHLTLDESNGDWHKRLLKNLNNKTKKIENGSKLESIKLNVCQLSKKSGDSNIACDNGIQFNRIKTLIMNSLNKYNQQNCIFDGLASIGHLVKLPKDNSDEEKLFEYSSDIETLGLEYDCHQSDGWNINIIDSLKIVNKIKFSKLKSLCYHTDRYFTDHHCGHESKYFNDLLKHINVLDKFFTNNQFKCINFKHRYDDDMDILHCYRCLFMKIHQIIAINTKFLVFFFFFVGLPKKNKTGK